MASKLGLMRKQEAANDRLRSATNRLRARGVDVGSFPDEGRDRDFREVERVEHSASLLEACCDRIDELIAGSGKVNKGGDAESAGYSDMKNKELIAEIERHGLDVPKPANKPALVAVLEAADAESESDKSEGNADNAGDAASEEPAASEGGEEKGEGGDAGDSVDRLPDGESQDGDRQEP